MDNKIPNILIIDDDPDLLATMSDVLRVKGFEPFSAQTGSAALAKLEDHDFAVALIDLRLGDMSGLDILSKIKVRAPETECILLTGHASQDSAIKAIQMNVFGFFQKPYDIKQVLLSIQQAVEKRAAGQALRESERFARATVDALSSHLAILDETGMILAVNRAWHEFAEANSAGKELNVYEGVNYLSVCETSQGENSEETPVMAAGIRAVISGDQKEFSLEYPCHSPEEKRWFNVRVTRFPGAGAVRVVVAHENITKRKQTEQKLKISEENLARRNKHLTILHNLTVSLLNHQDMSEIMQTLLNYSKVLLDAPYVNIDLLEDDNLLTTRATTANQQWLAGNKMRRGEEGHLSWQAIETGEVAVLDDYSNWDKRRPLLEKLHLHANVEVPIMREGKAIGVLSIARDEEDYPFNQQDLEAASLLGQIAALIIYNNHLYADAQNEITERKRAENELLEDKNFLSLLNDMTHAVLSAQNFEEMTKALTNDIASLLGADNCFITRWDPVKGQVFPVAASSKFAESYLNAVFEKGKPNITTFVLEAGRIIVVEDMGNSAYTSRQIAKDFPAKSAVGIPLVYAGNKLGAAIVAFEKHHQFSQIDLERAEQAGNQIALAMWNMQQDVELQRNLREAHILADIALALSETERIGLNNVLDLIVTSAQNLVSNAEKTVIHLVDEKEKTLISAAAAGFDSIIEGSDDGKRSIRLGEGVAGHVVLSGETVNIADVDTDPRFVKLGVEPSFRSLLVAPVHSGKQKLGTISIQSSQPYAFTPNDIKLFNQLGIQAAIAIDNANLLQKTKQALKEANALYRVNKGLVASLEPDDLLQDTVELLQKNFDYHYVQIFVADPDSGNFVMRAGSGKIGAQLKALGYQLTSGEGIVGYTAETGDAFFTNDVDGVVSFVRNPLLPDTKSELAIPVKIGKDIVGLLDIHQTPPKYLSQRDVQLVGAVADQLAVALQKADLYESLQISLQQEKAIRNQLMQNERLAVMGRLLATISHELNNPLQAIQNALFLLKEETHISEQGKQDLNIVLAESERMASLIERLRDTYRPTQADDFQPAQINDVVEDVYALVSTHLRHNQIAFEFHPDPELPTIPALADQIRQVVLNLLMNAVEAMTDGGTINVCTEYIKDLDEIMLSVADTGPGIPQNLLPAIFEAFITSKPSGTGLGLTISYDIIMKHRGRIAAENNPEQGAIFKVWLPTNNGEIL